MPAGVAPGDLRRDWEREGLLGATTRPCASARIRPSGTRRRPRRHQACTERPGDLLFPNPPRRSPVAEPARDQSSTPTEPAQPSFLRIEIARRATLLRT